MKPHSGNKYRVAGAMSGTSLDGLDLAVVEFIRNDATWQFNLLASETTLYSDSWHHKLSSAPEMNGENLLLLHNEYGSYVGSRILSFLKKHRLKPLLIASHGHTIFHQPEKGFTFQIGNGACIAAETGIPVVADFRTGDVALGGQGAPLVPVGDRLLFSDYNACLNLGGFANISFDQQGKRIAFDVCPVNFILNDLAQQSGLPFDENGKLGSSGNVDDVLLERLNQLPYYRVPPPKTLGREWAYANFQPLLTNSGTTPANKLRTVYEHIAIQIAASLQQSTRIMVTGGGAFNTFLIHCLRRHVQGSLEIPGSDLINYKEAIIFAFLGLLRHLEEVNCYASVTGAKRDSSTGVIFL